MILKGLAGVQLAGWVVHVAELHHLVVVMMRMMMMMARMMVMMMMLMILQVVHVAQVHHLVTDYSYRHDYRDDDDKVQG